MEAYVLSKKHIYQIEEYEYSFLQHNNMCGHSFVIKLIWLGQHFPDMNRNLLSHIQYTLQGLLSDLHFPLDITACSTTPIVARHGMTASVIPSFHFLDHSLCLA